MSTQEAEVNAETTSIYRHAAYKGFILGMLGMFMTVSAYLTDYTILASYKFIGVVLLIGVGLVIFSGIQYRKEVGGFLSYQKAFIHGFVMFATYGVISTVFNILLYTVIDPELAQKLTEEVLISTEEMLRSFNTPQSSIDAGLAKARTEMASQFTPLGLLWGMAKSMVGMAVISAITALFVRKDVPVEM